MKLRLPKGLAMALLAAGAVCFTLGTAQADYTWNGGESITNDAWNTAANWTVDGGSTAIDASNIPGVSGNAWDTIVINNASGTINELNGWKLRWHLFRFFGIKGQE